MISKFRHRQSYTRGVINVFISSSGKLPYIYTGFPGFSWLPVCCLVKPDQKNRQPQMVCIEKGCNRRIQKFHDSVAVKGAFDYIPSLLLMIEVVDQSYAVESGSAAEPYIPWYGRYPHPRLTYSNLPNKELTCI